MPSSKSKKRKNKSVEKRVKIPKKKEEKKPSGKKKQLYFSEKIWNCEAKKAIFSMGERSLYKGISVEVFWKSNCELI